MNLNKDTLNRSNGATELKNKAQSAGLQFEKAVENIGEKAGSMASDLANSTSDTLRTSQEYVKENPTKGVAIAAAAGIVVGSLLTMALRSPRS